jgi:hypothetical protein
MLVERQVARVSLGAALGLLLLCTACGDDGTGSVLLPPAHSYLYYYDAGVESTDAAYWPLLEDGDVLYSLSSYGDNHLVVVVLWPPPDSGCTRFLEVVATIAGRADFRSGSGEVCEMETVGTDTARFTCSFGWNLGFPIYTITRDTSIVYGFSWRVCCRDGGCLAWTDPISFTVIDTIAR